MISRRMNAVSPPIFKIQSLSANHLTRLKGYIKFLREAANTTKMEGWPRKWAKERTMLLKSDSRMRLECVVWDRHITWGHPER